ncbi:hypothetical protein BX600DRAFT_518337 [Xylariales sp. PMI_506]|nr:hypothetical protein BX600DRAFT_518337 [Xylariales sp. PMI_506]
MVGPPLVSPLSSDPSADYVPSAEVLASVPDERSGAVDRETNSQFSHEVPGPVLRAADMPDIRILRGLLRHRNIAGQPTFPPTNYMAGPLHGPWTVALNKAIAAGLPDHADLLLAHGASPDGFLPWCFRWAGRRFLRGRGRDITMAEPLGLHADHNDGAISDIGPPKPEELASRRRPGVTARFWAEEDFARTDYPANNPTSALVEAVRAGDLETYVRLVDRGADEMFWVRGRSGDEEQQGQLPEQVSFWAMESPLAAAIYQEDEAALRFLLKRGHLVDAFPAVLASRSQSPIMLAITKPGSPWLAGFDILWDSLSEGGNTVMQPTSIFQCHILHFAAATLNLDVIEHIMEKFQAGQTGKSTVSPITALGHTLLHVASLPRDDAVINMQRGPVRESVHEVRSLVEDWTSHALQDERERQRTKGHVLSRRGGRRAPPKLSVEVPPLENRAQAQMLRFLLDRLDKADHWKQDIHGNTILHYLSAVINPDAELLRHIVSLSGGKETYAEVKNLWGYSASNFTDVIL